MQNAADIYPPVQYEAKWFVIGIMCLAFVGIWFAVIWWVTRRKKERATGPNPVVPILPDIPKLKAKYLALIDEVEQAYAQGTMSVRSVHQKLSLLLRFFAYEAKGVRAPVLTLADIKRTQLTTIAAAIEQYYPPEFDEVQHGEVPAAIAIAREVVTTWA